MTATWTDGPSGESMLETEEQREIYRVMRSVRAPVYRPAPTRTVLPRAWTR